MGDEVEASAQRVRDHLRRTHHPERKLTDAKVGSTVNLTLPGTAGAPGGKFTTRPKEQTEVSCSSDTNTEQTSRATNERRPRRSRGKLHI